MLTMWANLALLDWVGVWFSSSEGSFLTSEPAQSEKGFVCGVRAVGLSSPTQSTSQASPLSCQGPGSAVFPAI